MTTEARALPFYETVTYETIKDLTIFCEKYDHIYIYGCDAQSEALLELLDNCSIAVKGYVTTHPDNRPLKYRELSVFTVSDIPHREQTGFILGLPSRYYNVAIANLMTNGFNNFFILGDHDKTIIQRKLSPKKLETFGVTVPIVDHCNLKCYGCCNFSNVADERFCDISSFERDMEQLRRILGDDWSCCLALAGGEPLLHPEIVKFIEIAHRVFPSISILIHTNGILLLKMGDEFWKALKPNNVQLTVTNYPIALDYSAIKQKASEWGVEINDFINAHGGDSKTSNRLPFDLTGQQIAGNFVSCIAFSWCTTIRDGKCYHCNVTSCAHIFNKYFDQDLCISEGDYIDIYKLENFEQLTAFLKKRPPFCKYCDVEHRTIIGPWRRSTKNIEEFINY